MRTIGSPRRILVVVMFAGLMFVSFLGWSLSSAPGSSPDDDFHLASIWCGWGEREALCESGAAPTSRRVPSPIAETSCFVREPSTSAACWDSGATGLSEATWLNTIDFYPPAFYSVMSTFASTDVERSVLTMRAVNSAFATALLTALFVTLPRRLRPMLAVSVLAAIVPLGVFITASTNPSSWAVISATVTFPAMLGALQTSGRQQWLLSLLAVIGGSLGASARVDSAAYAVFAGLLAWIATPERYSSRRAPALALIAVSVVATSSLALSNQVGTATSGLPLTGGGEVITAPLTMAEMLMNAALVPLLWISSFGLTPLGALGWFDTPLPFATGMCSLLVALGAIIAGGPSLTRRGNIATAVAFLALWLVPLALLIQSNATVGIVVQPRYVLPLLIIALAAVNSGSLALPRRLALTRIAAAVALSVANGFALHTNFQRYTTGLEAPDSGGASASWWWTFLPVSPDVVWLVATVAFAAFAVGLAFLSRGGWADEESRRGQTPAPTTAPAL